MSSVNRLLFIWVLAFAALFLDVASSSAQTDSNAILLTPQDGPLMAQPAAAALLAKARTRGSIPVIVVLAVELRDESTLSANQAAAQSRTLSEAQDGLIQRVLGGGRANANVKIYDIVPYVALTVTPSQLLRLLADPAVTTVQEDVPVPPTLAQSVPLIKANNVWTLGQTGANRIVAILDTGVQKTHSMIGAAKVISEACYSTTGSGSTSVCPAGSIVAPGSGVNCPLGVYGCDHGTHVASIAAGRKTSAPVLRGVAPAAQLIAIQIFSRFTGANCGSAPSPCVRAWNSDLLLGLQRVYALRNSFVGKTVVSVNMSLGGGAYSEPCAGHALEAVVKLLRNAGIATVIASGNNAYNGFIGAPACVPGAIAVGSTVKADNALSWFSNHSSYIQLLAPGSDINAAQAGGVFGIKSGTSMAAPHAAGAFALMRQAKPDAGVSQIMANLNCTGKLLQRTNIFRPRIDVLAARAKMIQADPTESFPFTNNANGWTPFLGAWSVAGGYYRSIDFNNWVQSVHNFCGHSFRVTARMKRNDTDSLAHWNSGVLIASATKKVGASSYVSGYWFAFNKSPGMGNAVVSRMNNVDWSTFTGTVTPLCSGNKPTVAGFNTVRVDVVNQVFKFFLNGTLICTFTDFSYPPAKVALYAQAPATGTGHRLFVDSVTITPIATTSLRSADTPVAEDMPVTAGGMAAR